MGFRWKLSVFGPISAGASPWPETKEAALWGARSPLAEQGELLAYGLSSLERQAFARRSARSLASGRVWGAAPVAVASGAERPQRAAPVSCGCPALVKQSRRRRW